MTSEKQENQQPADADEGLKAEKDIEKIDFEEKYLRCLAEMENMRKRLIKEQKDFARIAIERFVKNILEPIDNLENALLLSLSANDEVKNWLTGFEMIKQQFEDALSSQGVVSYEAKVGFFDPAIHEAVETVFDDSVPRGTIIKQFVKGYKMGTRIIRPAKVTVSCMEEKSEEKLKKNEIRNEEKNLGESNEQEEK